MKFRVYEDLETVLRRDYPENDYGYADTEAIEEMTYDSYSDSELWEAFKEIAWPKFSEKEKQEFLDDFEENYNSILEIPAEEGMQDRSWIIDVLEEFNFFDDDYSFYAGEYFDTDDYSDNLRDYKEYDEYKQGIGLGV